MRMWIDVQDRHEAAALRRGLADPQVRAFVKVMGTLVALPSDRARERVLRFVDDHFEEVDPAYQSVFRQP